MIEEFINLTFKGKPELIVGSFIFLNCLFLSCQDLKSSGGALFSDSSKGIVNIQFCFFQQCSSPSNNGGAIFCLNTNNLTIFGTIFIECTAEVGHSVFLYSQDLNLLIKFTTIIKCPIDPSENGIDTISIKGGNQDLIFFNSTKNEMNSQFAGFSTDESISFSLTYSIFESNRGSGILFFSHLKNNDIISNINCIKNKYGEQSLFSLTLGSTTIKNSLIYLNKGLNIVSLSSSQLIFEKCKIISNYGDISILKLIDCITTGLISTLLIPTNFHEINNFKELIETEEIINLNSLKNSEINLTKIIILILIFLLILTFLYKFKFNCNRLDKVPASNFIIDTNQI